MKYIGDFYSLNKTLYKIEIETAKGGADKTLLLSGSPFKSSISSEDKHIYSPIKCGGATVGILTDSFNSDFYSGLPKANKVTLYNVSEGNKVEWVGYITPSIYTLGFDSDLEEIELDCIDGIAVLKDIKYSTDQKDIKSFAEIIAYCLNLAGCYSNLYISDNVQLTSATTSDSVIEIFRMSETGLFDKKDDVTLPDEDVAWSCYDVLYLICQFLGYTIISEGDSVIILDYDAIKKGNNTYFKYALGSSTLKNPSKVTLSFSYHITGDSYAENGTSIEMTPIYNKVTVADEFNALSAEETSTEASLNITAPSDPYFNESWIEGKGIGNWYDTCDTIVEEDDFGNNLTYQIAVHRLHSERWVYTVIKYYDNPKYTFFRYSKNAPYTPLTRETDGVGYVMNSRGGTLCKYCHIDLGDDSAWHASPLYTNRNNLSAMSMESRRREWVRLLNSKLANLNYTDCIVMMNGNLGTDGHIGISRVEDTYEYHRADIRLVDSEAITEPYQNYPVFEYNDDNPAIFGNRNSYLIIKGNVTTHDEWWNPFPMNNGLDNESLKYKKKLKCVYGMFIWAKLQWGDQWWTGSNWRSTECFFKLHWWKGIPELVGGGTKDTYLIFEQHYAKRYFDRNLPLLDVDRANYIVGEEGYYVNAPTDGNLNGKIKLTMYMPRDIWDLNDKRCDRYYTCVQCLSDFKIESSINTGGSLGDDSALDSDTVYTNVLNNGSIEEMDEITFKVNTFDSKNTSYSVVDYLNDSGNSTFVDTTYNKANYSGEGIAMRLEEHLIYKLVTQYQDPRLVLNCNLKLSINPKLYGLYTDKTLSGKSFIIDEIENDYKLNKSAIKLIEKA